eukprot:scaffold31771_cov129-Isochrysis_galbana.AAC.3
MQLPAAEGAAAPGCGAWAERDLPALPGQDDVFAAELVADGGTARCGRADGGGATWCLAGAHVILSQTIIARSMRRNRMAGGPTRNE